MGQASALGWTLLCEVPIILVLCRAWPARRVLIVAASATLITHPLAWKAAVLLSPEQYCTGILVLEAAIVGVEAFWLYVWLRPRIATAALWSLLANSASFVTGMVLLR